MHIHHAILAASTTLFLAPLTTGCGTTATISRVQTPRVSVLPVAALQKNNEFVGANLSIKY
jgi:hypothetical protein